MAYKGWLWTHGYNFNQVNTDVIAMFTNPVKSLAIFRAYNISYIVIGPSEIKDYQANLTEFDKKFSLVIETKNYKIYAL
jgi:uncharacterized membrane protein